MTEIPDIRNFPDSVQLGIGERVNIEIHTPDEPGNQSSHTMIEEVIDETFSRELIPNERRLRRVCALVARVAVGRLVTSEGFTVVRANETIDVDLSPPKISTAKVTHTTQE